MNGQEQMEIERELVAREEAIAKGWRPSFDPDDWVGCEDCEGDADVPAGVPPLRQQVEWFLRAHKKRMEEAVEWT